MGSRNITFLWDVGNIRYSVHVIPHNLPFLFDSGALILIVMFRWKQFQKNILVESTHGFYIPWEMFSWFTTSPVVHREHNLKISAITDVFTSCCTNNLEIIVFWNIFSIPNSFHSKKNSKENISKNIDFSPWSNQCDFHKLQLFSYFRILWSSSCVKQFIICVL